MEGGDATGPGSATSWGTDKGAAGNKCPVCGAPGGKQRCAECGWSVEELGAVFSDSLKDPVTTLINAKEKFLSLKQDKKRLEENVKSLMINNNKFSELVQAMAAEIQRIKSVKKIKYGYNYGEGGWGEIDESDTDKLHLKKKKITVDDLNNQLLGIMRMLDKYGKAGEGKKGA
ncbi:MAG: hypothetical protein JXC85_00065 [Candidatus Aenigmarchaeota archaeon]|nr:hypothetical protein [Candidatus Aenigmarchaeota archaeon]